MTEEKKAKLDAMAESITRDERVTIPGDDNIALRAEIHRLTEKLQRQRQRLIAVSNSLNAACALIDSLLLDT